MKLLILIFLSACFTFSGWQQNSAATKRPQSRPEILKVDFCDLLANPAAYDMKAVRTTAILRYGGEDSADLYCPECLTKETGKPALSRSYESCTKPKLVEKVSREKHSSGTVKVVMIGTFSTERQLNIECVEQAT